MGLLREEETEIDVDLRVARAWMTHTNIAHELEVSSSEEIDGPSQEGTADQTIIVSPGHTSYGKFLALIFYSHVRKALETITLRL
jgi:hypothetical protein